MKPKTVRRAQVAKQAIPTSRTREIPTPRTGRKTPLCDVRLTADTLVMTPEGPRPAYMLKSGDRVVSRDSGTVRIDQTRFTASLTRTITFSAASCGADHDLILPASQPIWLRDWRALVFAKRKPAAVAAFELIDEEFVRDLGHQALDLVHLQFSQPQVIYAGGIELATHLGHTYSPELVA